MNDKAEKIAITPNNATAIQAGRKVINEDTNRTFFAAWLRQVMGLTHESINTPELRQSTMVELFEKGLGANKDDVKRRYNNSVRKQAGIAANAVGYAIPAGSMKCAPGGGERDTKPVYKFPLTLEKYIQPEDKAPAPNKDNTTTPNNGDTTGNQRGTAPASQPVNAVTLCDEVITACNGDKDMVIETILNIALTLTQKDVAKLARAMNRAAKKIAEQQASEQQASEQQASEKAA